MNDMFNVILMSIPLGLACVALFTASYWAPVWVPRVAIPIMRWITGGLEFIGRIWEAKVRPGRW